LYIACDQLPNVQQTFANCDTVYVEANWKPASCGCATFVPGFDGCFDTYTSRLNHPQPTTDLSPFINCSDIPQLSPLSAAPFYYYDNVIRFPRAGTYYAMCTQDSHCKNGQKLIIIVKNRSYKASKAVYSAKTGSLTSPTTYILPFPAAGGPWGFYLHYDNLFINTGDSVEFLFDLAAHSVWVSPDITAMGLNISDPNSALGLCNDANFTATATYEAGLPNNGNETFTETITTIDVPFNTAGVYFVFCALPQHCSIGMNFFVTVTDNSIPPGA